MAITAPPAIEKYEGFGGSEAVRSVEFQTKRRLALWYVLSTSATYSRLPEPDTN
jgi:hypothetical protein